MHISLDKDRTFLIAVFLFALILRVAYWGFLKQNYFFYENPGSDVTYYQKWAQAINLNDTLAQKNFWGLPLYPYFLSILGGISLGHLELMRFGHILLGAINCALIFLVARKAFSVPVARIASILAASNFILIYYDWLMMPVGLLINLSLLIAYALINRPAAPREWLIIGILLGLGVHGDGKFLFAALLIFAGLAWQNRYTFGKIFRQALLPMGIGLLVIIAVFLVRSRVILGDWVFVSTQSGLSFYVGNNADADGTFDNPVFIRPTHDAQDEDQKIVAQALAERTLSANEISQFWRRKGLEFIAENPADYALLLVKKFRVFFQDAERAHDIDLILQRDWQRRLDYNPFWILCPVAFFGLILAGSFRRETLPLSVWIFAQLLLTLIFFVSTRHRASILPFFIIFEAYALHEISLHLRQGSYPLAAGLAGALIVYALIFAPQPLTGTLRDYLHHSKSGPVYEAKGDLLQARAHYQQALKLRPSDTNSLYNLGNTYLQEGDFAAARDIYLKTIAACSYHVDAFFNLGEAYEQLGEPKKALDAYAQVLVYQPESLDVHYRLGMLYRQKGDCAAAAGHFSHILNRRPRLAAQLAPVIDSCRAER